MEYDFDLCILFFYHRPDELTKVHLASLRKSNPSACVLPVADGEPKLLLPGTVDVARFPSFCDEAGKWRSVDARLYRWFVNRTFNARRYLVAEYDCRCDVSLKDHYAEVWDADVSGVDFFTRKDNPGWRVFRNRDEVNRLPPEDTPYAAAIVPFTCVMFSHAALERIVAAVYRHDVFSELRLGTIVNKLGLKFQQLPLQKRGTLCWHEYPWQINQPGFFHAVKSLDHNQGKRRQPLGFSALVYDMLRSKNRDREFLPVAARAARRSLKRRLLPRQLTQLFR